ncbi:MAG: glycoside hydrolase family 2, partial [Clostridia bacterium]|nr:glycoside hydrolase family 2 [Clostridia bacterium]
VYGAENGEIECEGENYPIENGVCRIGIDSPRLWSPEEPNLYEFTVKSGGDEVESYFAFRTVDVGEVSGKPRLLLNGKPYFFNGLLDQGYYSDGLWTPAEPEEYERDIMKMKSLGFNTLRKHIKVEPELFYYYCDKLGVAVFQDMVNNGKYSFFRDTLLPTLGITRLGDRARAKYGDPNTQEQFISSMNRTVRELRRHPSIVYWTIFNEGWGQFDADGAYECLRQLDGTRIIDSTSGWFHQKKTDVDSLHIYFKKLRLGKRRELPQVVSEFGGCVLKLPEHSFNLGKTYGYRIFKTRDAFVRGMHELYKSELLPLIEKGLSAAVYTQVSDVEDETNGILTYDRRVMKLAPEDMAGIAEALQEAVKK